MVNLVLVLGDQLTPTIAALTATNKATDVVVMAEVVDEATYVPHHPKKIALIFAAMRKFAAQLCAAGWRVRYTRLDDPANAGSIVGELIRAAAEARADRVIATQPGEWRLIAALRDCPVPVDMLEDTRFIASHTTFAAWAKGRKQLRMEYFYRDMRRKTGLLMDGAKPVGGKWNFDHDNRKPAKADLLRPAPLRFAPDATVSQVLDLVRTRFGHGFGDLDPFWYATDAGQAQQVVDHFVAHNLPQFGDYQDAMLTGDKFLHHSLISAYINIGLLDPLTVCRQVAAAYAAGTAPINAVEGFIRQIIGWREYIRGVYYLKGPEYTATNALDHTRDLPAFYWSGQTDMACLHHAIAQTKEDAYAHHIQRLMITGNFALLAGVDPAQVHEWYLAVYIDAFEWVEAPNTLGMSQFADGGVVASKPYVSGGAYINRMSNYCKGCTLTISQF